MAKLLATEFASAPRRNLFMAYLLTGLGTALIWLGVGVLLRMIGVSSPQAGYVAHVIALCSSLITLSILKIPRAVLAAVATTISVWSLANLMGSADAVLYLGAGLLYVVAFVLFCLVSGFRRVDVAVIMTIVLTVLMSIIFLR